MRTESVLDRKDRLRGEGKVQLPLSVDTKKYFIGNVSFKDIAVTSPFIVLSLIIMIILKNLGYLNTNTILISLTPTLIIMALQLIKHPIRNKDVTFLQYGVIWRFKYNKRKKEFIYKKGEIDMSKEDGDLRKELGIKNVFSGCYETTDNRFVKVIEVSSINISLMNEYESKGVFTSYATFLNEMSYLKDIQIEEIAQPVNLNKYLNYINELTEHETNTVKRMISKSYKNQVVNIQKSKNMVAKKKYVIISEPIGSDREKALKEIDRKVSLMQTNIENMIRGYAKLTAHVLQNDELTKLMYTCIDYDNAQAIGDYIVSRANNQSSISLGENSAKQLMETLKTQLENSIN